MFVYYYKDKVDISLKVDEFINFIKKDVLTNAEYSKNISQKVKDNIDTITKFLDKNTLNKSMGSAEMAYLFGIEEDKVKDLYLYYYSIHGTKNKMTLNKFANYVLDRILTDEEYSDMLDSSAVESLEQLETMSDLKVINKKMTPKELSAIFGMNEETIKSILTLKSTMQDNGTLKISNISPYEFVKFLINNSSNATISANMDKETLEKLKTAYKIMNSAQNETKYTYSDMADFIGVEEDTTRKIYALYVSEHQGFTLSPTKFAKFILEYQNDSLLKDNLNKETIFDLELVDKIMDAVLSDKRYKTDGISDLLDIDIEDTKLLYSLYSAKYINSNMQSSLKEFVEFTLSDIVTNEKYKDKFDNSKISKLNAIKKIMDASLNNTQFTSKSIFSMLRPLTNDIDQDTIDILYIYYGSEKNYNEDWAVTLEEFINYVNDKILPDSKFQDFIDDDTRTKVTDAKDEINDNKKLLVGENHSRIVLNTKFDPEGEETYGFLQKIYDIFEGKEIYVIGDSPMAYEMSKTFESEFDKISVITMIAIFIVVAITFKSIGIPFALVLIIQCAVYMTMGYLSLLGGEIYFIAILIVQSILMGATIDYAILYTSYYIELRKELDRKEAIIESYNKSIHTILTSASILILATFIVGKFATAIISKICMTLSQGVFCSTIVILLILPEILAVFDRFINRKNKKFT